jgi:hypothetical protein
MQAALFIGFIAKKAETDEQTLTCVALQSESSNRCGFAEQIDDRWQ